MKKFLTLLFTLAVAFSLSMPAFSQEAGGMQGEKKEETGKEAKKAKKGKKGSKKSKKEEKKEGEGAAPQQ